MLILDTDHLTVIQRQSDPAYSCLLSRIREGSFSEIYTTIVNFEEQMRGWLAVIRVCRETPSGYHISCLTTRKSKYMVAKRVKLGVLRHALISRFRSGQQEIAAYRQLHAMLSFFGNIPVLDFDETAADRFIQLRRLRVRIGSMDLKIASITLSLGATLLSRNLADFQLVPGLQVEDWTH